MAQAMLRSLATPVTKALFLCSSLGSGVTGETLHVDAGQNIMGVVSMG